VRAPFKGDYATQQSSGSKNHLKRFGQPKAAISRDCDNDRRNRRRLTTNSGQSSGYRNFPGRPGDSLTAYLP
jgi:hypothetical protein